jgi:hypothetical protein
VLVVHLRLRVTSDDVGRESVTVSELNRQTAQVLARIKAGESLEISVISASSNS